MPETGSVRVPRSQVSVKTVLTVALTVLAVIVALYIIGHAKVALWLTIAGGLLAVALDRPAAALQRKGLPRTAAVLAVVAALLAVVTGVLVLLVPPAVKQGKELVKQAPSLLEKAKDTRVWKRLDRRLLLDEQLERLKSELQVEVAIGPGLKAVGGVLSGLAATVTLFFLVIFMLLFGGRGLRALLDEALPGRRERYERVLAKVYRSIGGYLSGLSLICLANATATTIFLAIIRVPYFLPLGIVSGLSSMVPLVGNTLAGILVSLVALASGGLWYGVGAAAYYILYQQFENHVLGPMVYKRTVELNPLAVVMGLLFFTDLLGIVGALIAVPAVAAGQIVLREGLAIRRERLKLPPAGPASPAAAPGVGELARQEP